MKVELKKETNLTFEDVKPGEVFVAESGAVYLKIRAIPNTKVNAIFVYSGNWSTFEDEAPIARIVKNAVLVEKE